MNKYSLAWGLRGSEESDGGHKVASTWSMIDHALNELEEKGGSVSLMKIDQEQVDGPYNLQVVGEDGKYLMGLNDTTGGHPKLRRFWDPRSRATGTLEIDDEPYDAREICFDLSLIKRMFKEFYELGDVSRDLLN
jgi:hypothetical protein